MTRHYDSINPKIIMIFPKQKTSQYAAVCKIFIDIFFYIQRRHLKKQKQLGIMSVLILSILSECYVGGGLIPEVVRDFYCHHQKRFVYICRKNHIHHRQMR